LAHANDEDTGLMRASEHAHVATNRLPCNSAVDSADGILLLGDSPQMREVRRLVRKFAPTMLPVLITGPTGSGKGLVAAALHKASGRKGRYVVANMAALGDGLFESELFGHVRGSFTSSTGPRRGLLQHADGGTVLLDEIHRLSVTAQPKLLRCLETQLVRPVGSDHEVHADFRIVAAANEDLETLVDVGRFQNDLLARLSRLVIDVPPLVDHLEDVPALAERFLHAAPANQAMRITDGGIRALLEYDWPRNVRELQVVIERAYVLAEEPYIDRADVQTAIASGTRRSNSAGRASRAVPGHPDTLAERERVIRSTLRETGGKVRLAAARLGISRMTLYRWMTELGIATPERRSSRRTLSAQSAGQSPDTS
jgi:DNA-binding NtrC family response regulator